MDRVDLVVHVEDLALIEGERFDNVVERVGVDRLFKRLTEEILPDFGIGDVFENGQDDVVTHKAFGGTEEAEVSHDHEFFIGAECVGFPKFDVFSHGNFCRHPVVSTAVEVVFPGPVVFEGHELVDINFIAVDKPFLIDLDSLFCIHGFCIHVFILLLTTFATFITDSASLGEGCLFSFNFDVARG